MNSRSIPWRIVVADDHSIVREGISLLIDAQPDMKVVAQANDGEEACRLTRELKPDLVIMDAIMPGLTGAQATERLLTTNPEVRVLAVSGYSDDVNVRRMLNAGASGYLLKKVTSQELADAIRTVVQGGVYLDPSVAGEVKNEQLNPPSSDNDLQSLSGRDVDVLIMVAHGYTNKEIAEKMHLSVKTIEALKTKIRDKMGLNSRAEMVNYALKRGWLSDEY